MFLPWTHLFKVKDCAGLMETGSLVPCLFDEVIRWHKDLSEAFKLLKELFFCNLHCLLELRVLIAAGWRVPLNIHAAHARSQSRLHMPPHILSFANSVVNGVHLQDQGIVEP